MCMSLSSIMGETCAKIITILISNICSADLLTAKDYMLQLAIITVMLDVNPHKVPAFLG